jgi:hypothetical protein
MSRHLINGDSGVFGSGKMDVMTIDGSRLQIPSSGVRGKSRVRAGDAWLALDKPQRDPSHHVVDSVASVSCSVIPNGNAKREEIVIDVRPRGESTPKTAGVETQQLFEAPSIVVLVGYLAFSLALALCNLLRPTLAQTVCVALSPLPMLCILAHAIGVQPTWIACGLVLCGWLAPCVCALWTVSFSVGYLVCLVSLVVAGSFKPLPALCLVAVIVCAPLALNPSWTGLEPKVWTTVSFFFAALACATAFAGGGKGVYRVLKTSL